MAKRAKKTRGPKPKFLDVSCPNPDCKHHGKRGRVISFPMAPTEPKAPAKHDSLFAEPVEKPSPVGPGLPSFFGLRSSKKKVHMGLKLLAEGLGLRGTSRVLEGQARYRSGMALHRCFAL